MKRTSALILTAAMVFTLASCGVPKKQGTTEDHYRLTFSMHTPRRHANWESIPGYV